MDLWKIVSLISSNLFLCQLVKLTIMEHSSIMSARLLYFFTPSPVSIICFLRLVDLWKMVSFTSSNLFLCQLVKLTITKRSSIMSARSLNFFTPSLVSSMSYYRLRTENKCECGSSNRNNKKVIWTLSKFLLQIRKWKKKIKIKRNTIYNIE